MPDLFAVLKLNIIDFLCSLPDVSSYEDKKNFITRTKITEPLKSRLQNYLSDNDETFFRNLIEKSQEIDGNYKSLISILREVKAGGLGQNKKDRCDFLIKILECYNDNKAWPSILFLYKDDEWLSEFLKNITRSIANINQNILKAELGLASLNDSILFDQVKSLIPHIKKIFIIYSDKFNRYYDQLSEDEKEKLLETIKEANENDKLGEILLDQTETIEDFKNISKNSVKYALSSDSFSQEILQPFLQELRALIRPVRQARSQKICFNWLHFTDLHMGLEDHQWYLPGIREHFLEDLAKLYEKSGPWDLVLFTGDLTNRGLEYQFTEVSTFLKRIWELFQDLGNDPLPVFCCVPGNHDLVRPDTAKIQDDWPNFPEIPETFWNAPADCPQGDITQNAFTNYTRWWNGLDKEVNKARVTPGLLPGDFSYTLEKNGKRLGIVGFNTSYLQLRDGNFERKLALHMAQFHTACKDQGDGPRWVKQHDAWILITHHPDNWLNPESRNNLTNEIICHGPFAAHICGHQHEPQMKEKYTDGYLDKRIMSGASLYGREYIGTEKRFKRIHGYNAGRIEFVGDTRKLLFWPRICSDKNPKKILKPDTEMNLVDEHTVPKEF